MATGDKPTAGNKRNVVLNLNVSEALRVVALLDEAIDLRALSHVTLVPSCTTEDDLRHLRRVRRKLRRQMVHPDQRRLLDDEEVCP